MRDRKDWPSREQLAPDGANLFITDTKNSRRPLQAWTGVFTLSYMLNNNKIKYLEKQMIFIKNIKNKFFIYIKSTNGSANNVDIVFICAYNKNKIN